MSNVVPQQIVIVPDLATFQSSPVAGYQGGRAQLAYLQGTVTEFDGGEGFYQLSDQDFSTPSNPPTVIVDSTGSRWKSANVTLTAAAIIALLTGTPLPVVAGGTGQATASAALDALTVQGANIAAAATTNLATATGEFVVVTGNGGPITALGTATAGIWRFVRFTGTPTLTHNGTSLILPGGANITVAAGDTAMFMSLGSGNWQCLFYTEIAGGTVGTLPIAQGGTGQVTSVAAYDALSAQGADIASATTTNIGAATGPYVNITGTTTITGLGTVTAGTERIVKFTGALTLTHNGTSLILPGAANITTAANDTAGFVSLGSGNWICLWYKRQSGQPIATALSVGSIAFTSTSGVIGTTTNDNAAAGSVGELIESSIAAGSAVSLTTATPANITSISLTAGDWDVWGSIMLSLNAATTMSAVRGDISLTSASTETNPNGGGSIFFRTAFTTGEGLGVPCGQRRISVASTTTVYLVARVEFAVNTCAGYGYIGARRVR